MMQIDDLFLFFHFKISMSTTHGNAAELFSGQNHALIYATARPTYPPDVFARIFQFAALSRRDHALDVATGSGQAALELAKIFERVTACDASAAQLAHASRHPRVHCVQCRAETVGDSIGPERSVDLVTAAQALHWFDVSRFYHEIKERVLRPGGSVACWGYCLFCFVPGGVLTDLQKIEEANAALHAVHDGVLGPYWDSRRKLIETKYEPFEAVAKQFFKRVDRQEMDVDRSGLSVENIVAYVRSWSSYQTYMAATREKEKESDADDDPAREFQNKLMKIAGCDGDDGDAARCMVAVRTPHFILLAKD